MSLTIFFYNIEFMGLIIFFLILIVICIALVLYGKDGESRSDTTDTALAVGVVGGVIFTLILIGLLIDMIIVI